MKNINIYVSYMGVHGLVDQELSSTNYSRPIADLYKAIAVPRLSTVLQSDLDSTLEKLFVDTELDKTYNIGIFYSSIGHESFTKLMSLVPSGTKVFFIKTTANEHNKHFRLFLTAMKAKGRDDAFKKVFRKDKFTDFDIKIEHEEGNTYVDDAADEFNASDWELLNNNPNLLARIYIKE